MHRALHASSRAADSAEHSSMISMENAANGLLCQYGRQSLDSSKVDDLDETCTIDDS
jgi:hypothetical protein